MISLSKSDFRLMNRKDKTFIAIGVVMLVIGSLSFSVSKAFACGGWFESSCGSSANSTDIQQNQQQTIAGNQQKMEIAVPNPVLQDSLERTNISKRLQIFSNPNKVSYIYLISYGKVMAFYTVKGKISSGTKRLTSTQQQVDSQNCQNYNNGNCAMTMEAPELDGTYGSSGEYIFFWTTDGIYVQWNGEYMMADQPLQLSTPPELVQTVK